MINLGIMPLLIVVVDSKYLSIGSFAKELFTNLIKVCGEDESRRIQDLRNNQTWVIISKGWRNLS